MATEVGDGGPSNPMVKFKMIMIGDLSAGKSDMMAKYFGKNDIKISKKRYKIF